jgi:hypothetical protein
MARAGTPKREVVRMENVLPECQKCNRGVMVPLSDYGRDGATIQYKAWVCTNPDCGFNIRIDNGEISFGKPLETSQK